MGAPSIGLGGLLLLLAASYFFGQDLITPVLEQTQTQVPVDSVPGAPPAETTPEEEERVEFVSFVLDDLQQTWSRILPDYQPAKLVLFRGAIRSGCGAAQSAMGPFYCPLDQKVYIDLAFYEELHRRFGAPGDFAQAYVIAHEIGHHLQKQLGIEEQVRRLQRARPEAANALSVRMELQADCFAGVWGHSTARRDILESGDVEEGLNAAAAIGDDRIQRQTTGEIQPEAFTHGSSEQRVAWFRRGLETGDPNQCDTFKEPG
jgi:predicted metalloprotease